MLNLAENITKNRIKKEKSPIAFYSFHELITADEKSECYSGEDELDLKILLAWFSGIFIIINEMNIECFNILLIKTLISSSNKHWYM